jgi:hypothetical protein
MIVSVVCRPSQRPTNARSVTYRWSLICKLIGFFVEVFLLPSAFLAQMFCCWITGSPGRAFKNERAGG